MPKFTEKQKTYNRIKKRFSKATKDYALLEEGDKILVVYTAKADGEQITALADASNELLNVTAEVLLRELCNEELYYAFLVFRGKLNGEMEWNMSRDSQHGAEFRIMPEYCSADRKLVDIIIVRGEDLVA